MTSRKQGEVVILLTRYESLGKTAILVCQRGGRVRTSQNLRDVI